MKKHWILIAALVLAFALCGCSAVKMMQALAPTAAPVEEAAEAPTEAPTPTPTEVPTPEPTETPTPEPTQKPFGAEDVYGVWSATKILYGDSIINTADLGAEVYFEFREDGTVYCVSSSVDDYDEETMAFEVEGTEVIFHDRVSDVTGVYDPETDTIAVEQESGGMFILERTPDAKVPERRDDSGDDEDSPVGKWELTKAVVLDQEVSAAAIGQYMCFLLNADGSAAQITDSGTENRLSWTLDGDTITLSAYTVKVFELKYDGETLTLPWETSGVEVELIFERVDAD